MSEKSNNLSQCHNSGIAVTTENVKISETVRSISVSPFHLISFLTVKWQTVWISQIFNFLKGSLILIIHLFATRWSWMKRRCHRCCFLWATVAPYSPRISRSTTSRKRTTALTASYESFMYVVTFIKNGE